MAFGIKFFYKPTPAKIRKYADSILASSFFISTSSIIGNYKVLAISFLLIGAFAKFFSNLFSDDQKDKDNDFR